MCKTNTSILFIRLTLLNPYKKHDTDWGQGCKQPGYRSSLIVLCRQRRKFKTVTVKWVDWELCFVQKLQLIFAFSPFISYNIHNIQNNIALKDSVVLYKKMKWFTQLILDVIIAIFMKFQPLPWYNAQVTVISITPVINL